MGWQSRLKWCLLGCLTGVLAIACASALLPSNMTNAVEMVANTDSANKARVLIGRETVTEEDTLIEMVVENVALSQIDNSALVVLKEEEGAHYLPILIGLLEARDISVAVEGVSFPRPLSSDLTCSIMGELGAKVDSIIIYDMTNDTFYANIVLLDNWAKTQIDSRPSDAIAIALRVGAPIYATDTVLQKAGVGPQQDDEDVPLVFTH